MVRPRCGRWGIVAIGLSALALLASSPNPGFARSTPKSSAKVRHPVLIPPAEEKDAAIVVDGASGHVLYARNADAIRRPASLTKMMTLYLLFEALDEGNITLTSKMRASAHAAAQEPTKLNLRPGEEIDVETAIKSLTVLSANDAAVVIAETLGGTEERFGELMTAKARELGMTNSNFHNASGLPDPKQLTTARDMALLGRHLAYDFPQYYTYFSTLSFSFDGRVYDTHDHLLGEFAGVDGIKTGYTRASGFNLVSSVVRDNKHIVGVVMGGTTYLSRDQEMMRLLSAAFDFAEQNPTVLADANAPWRGGKGPSADPFNTTPGGTNVVIASLNLDPPQSKAAKLAQARPAVTTVNTPITVVSAPITPPAAKEPPAPAKPVLASLTPSLPKALLASLTAPLPKPAVKPAAPAPVAKATPPAATTVASVQPAPKTSPAVSAQTNVPAPPKAVAAIAVTPTRLPPKVPYATWPGPGYGIPEPTAKPAVQLAELSLPKAKLDLPKQASRPAAVQSDAPAVSTLASTKTHNAASNDKRWAVQVGAYAKQSLAEQQLEAYAKLEASYFAQAEHMVTPFSAFDGRTLYRARFGLFAENVARDICKHMTERGQTCFATSQVR